MPLTYILIALAMSAIIWFVMKPLKKKLGNKPNTIPTDVPTNEEPVVLEPEPTPEMPEKPLPVNCQLAQFQPAPQDFFYVDCCGVPHKGQGFEPWEKRSPVSIDSNKPFFGMTLLDVEAEINC